MRSHGAQSQRIVQPLAQRHARRLLRQRGVRAADLSAIGRALLHNWSRAAAALSLMDEYAEREGWLGSDGAPQPFAKFYVSMLNAERHALRAMEDHLQLEQRGVDPVASLIEQGRAIRIAREHRENGG
jgi:hypothetical protein